MSVKVTKVKMLISFKPIKYVDPIKRFLRTSYKYDKTHPNVQKI